MLRFFYKLFTETQIKLSSEKKGDSQQLQWFCNACKGIPQVKCRLGAPMFLSSHMFP